MSPRVDDAELDGAMRRLAAGDRSAFEPLYATLHPRALSFARRRLRDDALAADAAQQTLMKMFARASEFQAGRSVLPWFYAICANEVRAIERKRGKVDEAPAPDDIADETDDAEAALERHELVLALDEAIASLDAASAEAIAAMLGERGRPVMTDTTFRKRVSRAYAKLRLFLEGLYVI